MLKINKKQLKGTVKEYRVFGYSLIPKKQTFVIENTTINNIIVTDKKLVHNLVKKKASKRLNILILKLSLLLNADDDTGEAYEIVLDRVEKFRVEVRNKYRMYLEKEELKEMAKKLQILKDEATKKIINVNNTNFSKLEGKGK